MKMRNHSLSKYFKPLIMITMAFSTSRFSVLKILKILVSFRFQEFLKLTDFAESGSVKDKLVWAFRIYDKDRSGFISVKEMVEMLGTIYTLEGFNKVSDENPEQTLIYFCFVCSSPRPLRGWSSSSTFSTLTGTGKSVWRSLSRDVWRTRRYSVFYSDINAR